MNTPHLAERLRMKMSRDGLIALAARECAVLSTYRDSVGVATIGIGHTAAAGAPVPAPGLTMTLEAVCDLFVHDVAKYEAQVARALTFPVAQHEFDALVSFHYNTGRIGALVKGRTKAQIGQALMLYKNPPEIFGRRRAEQRQFLTGDYGNLSTVPVKERHPGKTHRVPTDSLFMGVGETHDMEVEPGRPAEVHEDDAPHAPTPGGDPAPAPHGETSIEIELVQRRLKAMGYPPGGVDGRWGGMTAGAINAFRNDRHLPPGGIDEVLKAELDEAEREGFSRPVSEERKEATAKDIAPTVPAVRETAWQRLWAKLLAIPAGIAALFEGARGAIDEVREHLEPVREFFTDVPGWVWFALAASIGILIWHRARRAEQATLEAYRDGRIL